MTVVSLGELEKPPNNRVIEGTLYYLKNEWNSLRNLSLNIKKKTKKISDVVLLNG